MQTYLDDEKMYDYFIDDTHRRLATEDAEWCFSQLFADNNINFNGKHILDISGGNGHLALWFPDRFGARISFTEINQLALDYAKKELPFQTVSKFNLNTDKLAHISEEKFDIIMARACIMFCNDVPKFASKAIEALKKGGLLIVDRCVQPTLGILVRVQLDEFSYYALRQPETLQKAFLGQGFELMFRHDETDPSSYVYDHDFLPDWMFLHYFYEIAGLRALKGFRDFMIPARDRRRSAFFFRKPE